MIAFARRKTPAGSEAKMLQSQEYAPVSSGFSPLVLIDRLISLAEQADQAGMENVAGNLIALAYTVGDEPAN